MDDTISRTAAIDALDKVAEMFPYRIPGKAKTYRQYNEAWSDAIDAAENALEALPSAQLTQDLTKGCTDTISRAAAVSGISDLLMLELKGKRLPTYNEVYRAIYDLPSAQPPKEIPKRVLWSGWKGYRDTRYKCPNCEKPVRNDDAYCHRCGQRLMFPHISFTDYVPGEKQDVIVRWDDEG